MMREGRGGERSENAWLRAQPRAARHRWYLGVRTTADLLAVFAVLCVAVAAFITLALILSHTEPNQ